MSILLLSLVGCTSALHDASFPTGSQSIVAAEDASAVYAVDGDNGAVLREDLESGNLSSLEVGREPSRITRVGERLFVTLRAERAIVVLSDKNGTLTLEHRIETGAEPVGIVAREDGSRLYVALSSQNEVQELDGETFEVLRQFSIGGQPTWLALHPSGQGLYVASAYGGTLSYVNLENAHVSEIKLDQHQGAGEDGTSNLSRRLTGDMWVSSDGKVLAVPTLFVDNITPVEEPTSDGVSVGGYASVPGLGISRFNPAVMLVPLEREGSPLEDEVAPIFVGGFGMDSVVRSYVTSVTMSPDARMVLATMEASNTVIALPAIPTYNSNTTMLKDSGFDSGSRFVTPEEVGFSLQAGVVISTDAGPRGVAFAGDEAYIHSFLDRSIGPVWADAARGNLAEQFANGMIGSATLAAPHGTAMPDSLLDADVLAGRRLFYSATAPQMAADGAGVSCSTCHYEGRNDGLTWAFNDGGHQTLSLAGRVSETVPLTWTSQVPSVADEATITSQGRMGGDHLTAQQATQIATFVDTIRNVDLPMKGSEDAAVLRGQAIFERADVGCADCHGGSHFTDNKDHAMFGLNAVNTPGLVGIAATAPYLHDGTAATLMDVLIRSRAGVMGDTSMLSDAEMSDLEVYLNSL